MPSWIQDPETGELIPKDQYCRAEQSASYFVQGDVEAFVSPIDNTVIRTRRALEAHNRRHGVTDMRDYSPSWFERKAKERADSISGKKAKAERVNDLIRAFEQHNPR